MEDHRRLEPSPPKSHIHSFQVCLFQLKISHSAFQAVPVLIVIQLKYFICIFWFCLFNDFSEPIHDSTSIKRFPSVGPSDINFLHIGNDGLKLDKQPRSDAINFWNKLEQSSTKAYTKENEQKREELWTKFLTFLTQ